MTEEISLKVKILYAVLAVSLIVLVWTGDEGKQPIVYSGIDLQHSVGLIDSENALVLQESVARSGAVANTPSYVMNKGSYRATLNYSADKNGNVLELWEQGDKIAAWQLNYWEKELTVDFALSKDAKALQLRINYGGDGALTVKRLSLAPKTLFTPDN